MNSNRIFCKSLQESLIVSAFQFGRHTGIANVDNQGIIQEFNLGGGSHVSITL